MYRFIFLTFAFMGWGFYELSGGDEFEPIVRAEAEAENAPALNIARVEPTSPQQPVETVARADLIPAVQDVVIQVVQETAPAVAEVAPTPVVLNSLPTTRRLVSVPQPTPKEEIAKLGPSETDTQSLVPMRTKKVSAISLATVPDVDPDFRRVSGDRVNMRTGPGTEFSVIGRLYRDDEVEVLRDPGSGWVKLQVMESGRVGWMAARLLTKIDY